MTQVPSIQGRTILVEPEETRIITSYRPVVEPRPVSPLAAVLVIGGLSLAVWALVIAPVLRLAGRL